MTRAPRTGDQQRDSRVLVFSQRNLHTSKSLTTQYEFEDLLGDLDDVQVLAPPLAPYADTGAMSRRVLNGGLHRVGVPRRSPPWTKPSMRPTRVVGQHDLFFAVFSDANQLSFLNRLPGWRERSRTAVCFLLEVWSRAGPAPRRLLPAAQPVRPGPPVHPAGRAGAAGARLARPAVPARRRGRPRRRPAAPAVGPAAAGPGRLRVRPDVGRAAPAAAGDGGRPQPVLPVRHDRAGEGAGPRRAPRAAGQQPRARGLPPGAPDQRRAEAPQAHRREESLSTRYYEATAGGAVLLGSRPRTPDFDACFDWPDAVIDVPYDCADLAGVLDDLAGQPDRLAAARAANVRAALLRHDWAYRWEQLLTEAGLSVSPQVRARQALLQERAEAVTPEALSAAAARG